MGTSVDKYIGVSFAIMSGPGYFAQVSPGIISPSVLEHSFSGTLTNIIASGIVCVMDLNDQDGNLWQEDFTMNIEAFEECVHSRAFSFDSPYSKAGLAEKAANMAITIEVVKNNDGRTHCWECKSPTRDYGAVAGLPPVGQICTNCNK